MSQISTLNASAARIGQSADVLRDLADQVAREQGMEAVSDLIERMAVELSTIHRHTERGLALCTDMHAAVRVAGGAS